VTSPCPVCGGPIGPDDGFCEACGAELAPAAVSSGAAGGALDCPVCAADGREPAGVSPEGYCEFCGRKVPSGRDREELDVGLAAGVTDRGLRHVRNEDAMALAATRVAGEPVALAVVCDGVSSAPRPDEASLAAVRAAAGSLLPAVRAGDDPAAASAAAARAAGRAVGDLVGPAGAPAATYASAVVDGTGVTVCWLGDSRVYWLAADVSGSRCLTTDDSLAEELVAGGLATVDEAMASPQAHVITRWLGADLPEPEPHVARFEPPDNGVVLLCSDGLWNYQPAATELAAMALPAALTDALAAAADLVRFAVDAGGADNITTVLMPFPPAWPENSPRSER
jgi:serine/threonine protein phosphatase PrpC